MVNKVILLGFLGKDPETRTLDNGTKVSSFSMATTESYTDKNSGEKVENTEWHKVVLWKGLADICERYLQKGSKVYIEGKLTTRSWEQDGVTKYATEVIGNRLQMLGGNEPNQAPKETVNASPGLANPDPNDDLPF
jgi:single-strand DNA-binding protein